MADFGEIDLPHRLTEVVLRGGLDAEGAASHVGAVKIELQDLALGEAALQQHRQEGFLDLTLQGAFGRQEQILGHLLRDRRATLDDFVRLQVGRQRAKRAEDIDAPVLEEAAILGGQRRLDEGIGNIIKRDGVIVQDAALADLIAVLVEELHGELASEELALVELIERRDGEREHDDETAGAECQAFGGYFVEQALPAAKTEAGEEAGAGIPNIAYECPGFGKRRIELGVEPKPVDGPLAALASGKPILHVVSVPAFDSAASMAPAFGRYEARLSRFRRTVTYT